MVRAARSSIKWAGGTFTNASTGPSVTTSIWPVADCLTICDWRLLTNTPSRYPCQHRADASTAKLRGILLFLPPFLSRFSRRRADQPNSEEELNTQ